MKTQYIISNKHKLDDLFEQFNELRTLNNAQIESQWAVYLCIRVSGLLETCIRSIYISYCEGKAHANISKYVGHSFDGNRSQNMKPDNILKLAGAFSLEWRDELENFISDEGRKEALESVINIRNTAAHGGTTSISYNNVKGYYKKIWEIIEFIDQQCKNS